MNTESHMQPPTAPSQKNSGVFALLRSLIGRDNNDGVRRESLENLLIEQDERDEPLSHDEQALIKNILNIGDCTVKDIMIPRAQIRQVDSKWSVEKSARFVAQHPHSRYPVYDGDLDNVIGMVHIKDMLLSAISKKHTPITALLRPVIFVVPSMRALDLMLKMQINRQHVAIVIDEFGGVDGLVTIEDVVEEIVGDIIDEHDVQEVMYIENPDGTVSMDTRMELVDLENTFGLVLSDDEKDEDFDTLGGLLVFISARVPNLGEVITHEHSGLQFVIEKSDPRRICHVQLVNPKHIPTAK